jgi:hypothetical protein
MTKQNKINNLVSKGNALLKSWGIGYSSSNFHSLATYFNEVFKIVKHYKKYPQSTVEININFMLANPNGNGFAALQNVIAGLSLL